MRQRSPINYWDMLNEVLDMLWWPAAALVFVDWVCHLPYKTSLIIVGFAYCLGYIYMRCGQILRELRSTPDLRDMERIEQRLDGMDKSIRALRGTNDDRCSF